MYSETINDFDRKNIVFLVDCDRNSIYNSNVSDPFSCFESIRAFLIDQSRLSGFTAIDLRDPFKADCDLNNTRFNSLHYGHWNPYGHKVVAQQIVKLLNLSRAK